MRASLIEKETIVRDVLDRFKTQYQDGRYGEDKLEIIKKLEKHWKETRGNPLAETIDKIIGNSSWTMLKCDVCNEDKEEVWYFEPYYYDSYENPGMHICEKCLK